MRHKMLDALGDVSLFGRPVIGHLKVLQERARAQPQARQQVLADASSFATVRARRRELERLDLRMPDFALTLESI